MRLNSTLDAMFLHLPRHVDPSRDTTANVVVYRQLRQPWFPNTTMADASSTSPVHRASLTRSSILTIFRLPGGPNNGGSACPDPNNPGQQHSG